MKEIFTSVINSGAAASTSTGTANRAIADMANESVRCMAASITAASIANERAAVRSAAVRRAAVRRAVMVGAMICALIVGAIGMDASAAPRKSKSKAKAKTTKVVKAPRVKVERQPFITRVDAPKAPGGLDGKNIALWQSHGRYFDQQEGRWMWQRARLLGTVEDLFPQAFVLPYLVPMLENAGAYVMIPRERDLSTTEIIVDFDGGLAQPTYIEHDGAQKWQQATGRTGFGYAKAELSTGDNPFRMGTVREVKTVTKKDKVSTAQWYADFPEAGEFAVYISYASTPQSAKDARYTVNSLAGSREFEVNQTIGGGTWIYLGTFPFAAGKSDEPVVELSNLSSESGKLITADAVKIGGGVGNVLRSSPGEEATTSGYPRFTEGARYWMQWAGIPQSVYSVTSGTNDYEDDYKGRGMWVNYLAGGSSTVPGQKGLGIPIDLSLAFHTDAGTTGSPRSTVGTLPIVYTKGGTLGNGQSRQNSVRYANLVTDQIVNDIQTLYEPTWERRKLRDKPYHEAKEPQVPSMILELLSHQNFADMRYGLDPTFRFHVSRAIYKGILKYLHERDGVPYIVEPLPVQKFSISGSGKDYLLSWQPVDDPLEPTADPTYYIVYERIDDGAFTEYAVVDDPRITVTIPDDRIYSYKIVAGNNGGISFPSEILSVCNLDNDKPQVEIVNGFTRISGPAEIYANGHVGFDYESDHGVPYISDIMFTGYQTEFRPEAKWINNDAPGHGASHATHETEIFAGNTFDFVYIHGQALKAAGYSFISSGVDAFVESMPDVAIIDLILGKQKEITVGTSEETKFKTFTATLRQRIADFCATGGSLFASGSYIGTDLFDNPHSLGETATADRRFAHLVLGIEWRQAQSATTGQVKEVKSKYTEFHPGFTFTFNQELNADCYAVESPESFAAADPSCGAAIFRYAENDYIAGVAYDPGSHRTVILGFPFETIHSSEARDSVMAQVMNFLTAPEGSHPGSRTKVTPENIIGQEARPLSRNASPVSRQNDPREVAELGESGNESGRRGKSQSKGKSKG